MTQPVEIERDEEMLGHLAELDLALAKAVYSRAIAAEDVDEVDRLGRTYQRLARSLRQTLALRDRMRRQRRQEARDNPSLRHEVRIARRKAELRTAVGRIIWNETEGEQQDYLWALLDQRLDDMRRADDWGLTPLDDHVAEVCAQLDLPLEAAARWRELPEVIARVIFEDARGREAEPASESELAGEWRSSA